MASTVDQIFKFVDNKEQIVGAFKNLMTDQVIFLGFVEGMDVKDVELVKIVRFDRWTKKSCEVDTMRAQEILGQLDASFQAAVNTETDEAKKAKYNEKYQQKREFIVKSVETVKENAAKTLAGWEEFKQGKKVLKYDEIYSTINEYIENSNVRKVKQPDKEWKNNNVASTGNAPVMSAEENNTVAQLLHELAQIRIDANKTQKALRNQWIKEFENDTKKSGALFTLKERDLKDKYNSIVEQCKFKYNSAMKKSDENIQRLEAEIAADRKTLAIKNNELNKLRKEESVKAIEAGDESLLQSDIGKSYTEVIAAINAAKNGIEAKKGIKKELIEARNAMEEKFKSSIKNAKQFIKEAREDSLPDKKNKLVGFFGRLKAKLGIGKTKVENTNCISKKAFDDLGELATSINNQNAKQARIIGKAIGCDIIGINNISEEGNDTNVA